MKKIVLMIGIVAILEAGCGKPQQPQSGEAPTAGTPSTPAQSQLKEAGTAVSSSELKEAPAIIRSSEPLEDDSTWSRKTTRTGVTLTFPTKGSNAPTWEYLLLDNNDPHLKGDCYVTEATVYKRTDFGGYEHACQTTSELNVGPGTRIDYFVFHSGHQDNSGKEVTETHLFTFTKNFPAGFDMNAYSLILEKIINIID